MKVMLSAFSLTLVALAACPGAALAGGVMGADASHCASGRGPAIQVNVSDLKDRTGLLRLELYPANDKDFMRPDMDRLLIERP